ncbi:MAG: adenylate/guanylate cyclase domain-containing protein [Novosphingobium sp.]
MAVFALQLIGVPAVGRIGDLFFDSYQRAAPRAPLDAPVQVVAIDEESIRRIGQWPWPRTEVGRLIEQLSAAGAAVVALDIVFAEPDRTSPGQLARQLPGADPAVLAAIRALPENDALFAETVSRTPVVSGYFLTPDPGRGNVAAKGGIAVSGSPPDAALRSYASAITPLPAIQEAASGTGFLTFAPDRDGIIRRVPLLARQNGQVVPSLSVEALRVAQQAGSVMVKTSDGSGNLSGGGAVGVTALKVGDFTVPTTRSGEMWVRYPAAGTAPAVPAWQVLQGALSHRQLERAFAGRIVFIGASAVGLHDLVATPVQDRELGVNLHAYAAQQMLTGEFLTRPDWADGLERALVLAFGIALLIVLPRIGALKGALLGGAFAAVALAGSWFSFTQARFLLDPAWPLAAILAVYIASTVTTFYREERRRSHIHRAFDHYLSPELVKRIAADPGQLQLGGEEREMTVMFADIRRFSALSERLAPTEITRFLIGFLTPMCDVLLERKATIDKFIGDAILAFWNAPLDDPDQYENAARATLGMVARLKALNLAPPQPWPGEVRIGIGLNAGPCCVGNIGSESRLSYSLIGDTVNLAARLEPLTKRYGVEIVIGEEFQRKIPDFAVLGLDRVRVAGRDTPENVYILVGDQVVARDPSFAMFAGTHEAMLVAYRAGNWAEAETLLASGEAGARDYGLIPLYRLYRERLAGAVPKDWDGVSSGVGKDG